MAKIYGQLERAQLEVRADDTAPLAPGLVWWNDSEKRAKIHDGTLVRSILRNDQKLILGNDASSANNVRLHRGAARTLQTVLGSDVTAEGTLSTNIAVFDSRIPTFTVATLPGLGNTGRLVWVSDKSAIMVDAGSAWQTVSSGGGSSSLQWVEDAAAPLSSFLSGILVYSFGSELGQTLYALVKVPSTYLTGNQIKLKFNVYVVGTSNGSASLQTASTLLRADNEPVASSTNVYTSTKVTKAFTPTTNDKIQAVEIELCTTDGKINGVAVAKGDLIKIALSRVAVDAGTTATTDPVNVIAHGTEVTFV